MPVVALTPGRTMPSRVQQTCAENGAPLDSALDGAAARFLDQLELSIRAQEHEHERHKESDHDTCEAAQLMTTES
jgi:hypothetical protein